MSTVMVAITVIASNILATMPASASTQSLYQDALTSWSKTLERFVDDQGRTDFIELAKDSAELEKFVAFIASTSPGSHPELFPTKEDVLAYHINTYNALAMHQVIAKKIPKDFNSFFKRVAFFKLRKITIGQKKTSLYDYENKVIRALDEPRIHFALNCMVRDCPRLPQEPFLADTLDKQLDDVTREFFSKEKHFRINDDARSVHLSWIVDYYAEDFVASGKTKDLVPYVNTYLNRPIPEEYKIHVIKYDWTINQQPKS